MSKAVEREPLTARIRHLVYGGRRAPGGGELSGSAPSALSNAFSVGMFGRFDAPGEFDSPPDEPVVLEGEVPWELADSDPGENEGKSETR